MVTIAPKKGDHLIIDTSWGGRWIQHHGICVGNGNVIHFKRDREGTNILDFLFSHVVIDKTPMKAFDEGRESYIVPYDSVPCFPPDEVVKRAEHFLRLQREAIQLQREGKQLEERLKEIRYNFMEFNCEHFASYCKTGRKISLQVENGVYHAREAVDISAPLWLAGMESFSFSDD